MVPVLIKDDSPTISTSGPVRVLRRVDGYYVVGRGLCVKMNDYSEAIEFIGEQVPELEAMGILEEDSDDS